jgi:hypothetical protein
MVHATTHWRSVKSCESLQTTEMKLKWLYLCNYPNNDTCLLGFFAVSGRIHEIRASVYQSLWMIMKLFAAEQSREGSESLRTACELIWFYEETVKYTTELDYWYHISGAHAYRLPELHYWAYTCMEAWIEQHRYHLKKGVMYHFIVVHARQAREGRDQIVTNSKIMMRRFR